MTESDAIDGTSPANEAPDMCPGRSTTGSIPRGHVKDAPVRTAVLLAAGRGSRLQPATHTVPKCLSEVNGVPILEQ